MDLLAPFRRSSRHQRVPDVNRQLALGLRPDRATVLWLIGGLALVLLPHLPRLPWWYLPVFVVAAGERIAHEFFRFPPLNPWTRLILTAGAIVAVAFDYGTILGRQAGVALMSVMIALKLLETYRRRDVYFLISLAYFVAMTQFLFSQSVYLIVYIAACVLFITAALVINELQPSRIAGSSGRGEGLTALLRSVLVMTAQALPIMLALFLLFPRLSTPLWGMPEDALDAKTGVSGEMSPGSVLELFLDDTPAFRVTFEGPAPPREQLYWRGPVLWDFDGITWRRPEMALRSPAQVEDSRVSNPLRYRVNMEPTERRWLFGLDLPLQAPAGAYLQLDHTLYRPKPVIKLLSYDMVSDAGYVLDPQLSVLRRRAALALPQGFNPRAFSLGTDWRRRHGNDDGAIIREALALFNREFIYSYQPPPLGRHTVDDFLFDTREGYCEYFASAFTVLMRAARIPARVVTGYQGGWYNETGDYVLVRNSDAHAWAEVWLEGQGWVRVDPTAAVAPERVRSGAREAANVRREGMNYRWLQALQNRFDTLHNAWNQWVLKYDRGKQRNLFQPLGMDDLNPGYAVALVVLVAGIVVTIVTRRLLRNQWLGGLDPASREFARFCRKLRRSGLPRHPAEGPRELGQRAAARFPHRSDEVAEITDRYIQLRYAPDADDEALKCLRAAVRSFSTRAG